MFEDALAFFVTTLGILCLAATAKLVVEFVRKEAK